MWPFKYETLVQIFILKEIFSFCIFLFLDFLSSTKCSMFGIQLNINNRVIILKDFEKNSASFLKIKSIVYSRKIVLLVSLCIKSVVRSLDRLLFYGIFLKFLLEFLESWWPISRTLFWNYKSTKFFEKLTKVFFTYRLLVSFFDMVALPCHYHTLQVVKRNYRRASGIRVRVNLPYFWAFWLRDKCNLHAICIRNDLPARNFWCLAVTTIS